MRRCKWVLELKARARYNRALEQRKVIIPQQFALKFCPFHKI